MAGSIGDDLAEVLNELTTPCTVHTVSGITAEEHAELEHYAEHSSEFIRQYCFGGMHPNTSIVDYGTVIEVDGVSHLVVNIKKERFEGELVTKNTFIVQCNTLGMMKRYTETRDDNYVLTKGWATITGYASCAGLMNDRQRLDEGFSANSQMVSDITYDLYIPKYAKVREGDRWYPDKDDDERYFTVRRVMQQRYKNCHTIVLGTDTRE